MNFRNIRDYYKNKNITSYKKNTTVFFLLAIAIVLPLLNGKYFFLLDFVPRINNDFIYKLFYGEITPIYGGGLPLHIFSFFISYGLFQKIFLIIILFLSGLFVYYIVPIDSKYARFFAGLLYMINPYTYIRILVGQWFILFSYAVLPLSLKAFIELLERKKGKDIVKFVFILTLVGFSTHTLIVALITIGIIFIFWLWKNRDFEAVKGVIYAGILFVLLNAYWLIPLSTANGTLVSSIGNEDLVAFAPRVESFSALFTLASMHGFWRAGYVYAKDFLPLWQILFIFILFLTVYGFISYYKDEKIAIYVKSFAFVGVIGLILAAGIQSPFSESLRWLFENTPLKGMRDSHKFVTLLALAYAYLGALGVGSLSEEIRFKENWKRYIFIAFVALALATPLVYSFTFFNEFAGQIKSTDYPVDWYEVNELLNQDDQDFKVLFLPWHLYTNFHWILNKDKRIVNPAPYFFDKEVISGKNIEIGGIYNQVDSPDQLYINFLLSEQGNITNFGELLAPLNIKYILLTKEVDYKKYFFLFNQTDLELLKETTNFYVFRNKREVEKIYEVNSMAYISGWDELLERSRSEDITERGYLIGDSQGNTQGSSDKKSLDYEKESPVSYMLKERASKKYLIFTEPYSESWEFGGKKPVKAYGMVNAYEVDGAEGEEIRYERFYIVYLPSYVISILTFAALIMFYFDLHKKRPELPGKGTEGTFNREHQA